MFQTHPTASSKRPLQTRRLPMGHQEVLVVLWKMPQLRGGSNLKMRRFNQKKWGKPKIDHEISCRYKGRSLKIMDM